MDGTNSRVLISNRLKGDCMPGRRCMAAAKTGASMACAVPILESGSLVSDTGLGLHQASSACLAWHVTVELLRLARVVREKGACMDSIGVVVPCLNEAANLELLLPRIQTVIRAFHVPTTVYVVDGGSTDGTVETAERLGARVMQQRGTGYGGAIKTALEDIGTTHIITLDADLSHHPAVLRHLYEVRNSADIVIASRYVSQGYGRMPLPRVILSGLLNLAFRTILDLDVRDTSSGYRLYRRDAVLKLGLTFSTYAVLQEILVKAICEGYHIEEIPFHYRPRRHGQTHARLLRFGRDYLAALRRLWVLRNSIESADYDCRAFHSRIPLQRWWQRRRYEIVLELIGDRRRVLDAGCGSTQILNGAPQTVGLDIQRRKLRYMRRPGRNLVNGSTCALPFADGSFEVVVSSQVIEHLPRDAGALDELVRCVAPGGCLIVGTPDYGRWQWPLIEKVYGFVKSRGYAGEHITHYTFPQLVEDLSAMGLEVQEHRYILGAELIIKAHKPL
jgi:glycosyltransferase involved in cell wall biosynthesis